jgi:HEAT repeat protein
LRGEGPPLDDPDPLSLAEREVNRRWAAIRRLGENQVYAADDLIRRQLYAEDPSLRAEAIHVLLGLWHRMDLLGLAINVSADPNEEPMIRMTAIEALGTSGAIETESVRKLVETLAVRDDAPGIKRAALNALGMK